MRVIRVMLIAGLFLPVHLIAQNQLNQTADSAVNVVVDIPSKSLAALNRKYTALTKEVDVKTLRMLEGMQKKEDRLKAYLTKIDSSKAIALFQNTNSRYQVLETHLQTPVNRIQQGEHLLKQYIPGLDSTSTLMHFLLSGNIVPEKLARVQAIGNQLTELEGRMQQANEAQDFVREREQLLREQLARYNLGGQLLRINKEVSYYQTQLQQYKDVLNDKEKLEQAIYAKVRTLPIFQNFMKRNSMFAQLFPMPEDPTSSATSTLTGLQTRGQLTNFLSGRMPSGADGGSDPTQYIQQQVGQAQCTINGLQQKLQQLTGSGSGGGNSTMPDFSPNGQKTKSFLHRFTFGLNFQTLAATNAVPAISDIGFSIGYKISSKAIIGTGASYKLGMGRGISHLALTSQGAGLRGFVDIKAKGSIWISGGFEYNYIQAFAKLAEIKNINAWQKSALAGISKKYMVGKKEGSAQLLYDFLYNQHGVQGHPLVFRVGYNF